MDYKTKPISRNELRIIANFFRQAFGCKKRLKFNVIDAFERAPLVFPFLITTVVEDDELPEDIPARCIPDFNGNYLVEVKNSVYEGAVEEVGGYRDHIIHEMCHGVLCKLGFTPIMERAFKNNELKPYESMEWQAKALCGEILVPYERTAGMTARQIRHYCKVSYDCAEFRANEFRKKRNDSKKKGDEAIYDFDK